MSESTIIDCAKNLKMTKKAFLKVLEVAKDNIVIENAFLKVLEESKEMRKKTADDIKKRDEKKVKKVVRKNMSKREEYIEEIKNRDIKIKELKNIIHQKGLRIEVMLQEDWDL